MLANRSRLAHVRAETINPARLPALNPGAPRGRLFPAYSLEVPRVRQQR